MSTDARTIATEQALLTEVAGLIAGAKAQAAVALPIPRDGAVAVVGLAWMDDRELPESLLEQLAKDAASVEF